MSELTSTQIQDFYKVHIPYVRGAMHGHRKMVSPGPYHGDTDILNAAFIGSLIASRMILEFLGVSVSRSGTQLISPVNRRTDSVYIEDLGGMPVDIDDINQDQNKRDLLVGFIRMAHKAAGHITVPEQRPWQGFSEMVALIDGLLDQQLKTLPCAENV